MWGYGHDWGMMDGWGGGAFGMIIWPLVLIALVVGVIWYVRSRSVMRAAKLNATNICKRNKRFPAENFLLVEFILMARSLLPPRSLASDSTSEIELERADQCHHKTIAVAGAVPGEVGPDRELIWKV